MFSYGVPGDLPTRKTILSGTGNGAYILHSLIVHCTVYSTPAILLTQLKDYPLLTLIVKLLYIIHVLVIPIIVLYTRGGFPTIFQDFFMIHMRELNLNFSLFLIFTQEHFYVSVVFKF